MTSNPKDPTPILALLDGGANCNLISNRRAILSQVEPKIEEGNIKFGNDSTNMITQSVMLEITAKQGLISFTFKAKFFICELSEDMIIGRPTLNSTGLIHLYITEGDVSPNPFAVHSSIIIETMDDKLGELDEDDDVERFVEPAFDQNTVNLWEKFSESLGISSEELFNLIYWAASQTEIDSQDLLRNASKYVSQLPSQYVRFRRSDLEIERKSDSRAPWKELNKAVYTIQNALNSVWDIANRGIAKFRPMHIPFDWSKYKAVRVNAQHLNEPMSNALKDLLNGFESKGLIADIPREKVDALTTISPLMVYPKKDPTKYRLLWDGKRSGVNAASLPISKLPCDPLGHLCQLRVCWVDGRRHSSLVHFLWLNKAK
jgi:hypothetical protein